MAVPKLEREVAACWVTNAVSGLRLEERKRSFLEPNSIKKSA
jgi:hypothetical protein